VVIFRRSKRACSVAEAAMEDRMAGKDLPARRGGLRARPQRWRVATTGWVAMQAGGSRWSWPE